MENELDKQTAVEWLWEQIDKILPFSVDTETGIKLYNAKEQAKQMEKEQIMDAHYAPKYGCFNKDYYEQTYGGNK